MAKKGSWNPIAFVPVQVTLIASAIYIALFALLIWVHTTVPAAPRDPTPVKGINLTEAWLDLDFISNGYHPIDSRRNEAVREYLGTRIEEILNANEADYKVVTGTGAKSKDGPRAVTVFKDDVSNVTFVDDFRKEPWTCYGESDNIMVYIRGEDEEAHDWWQEDGKYDGQSGVLVNAHFDSVSSGYGATDDGVGVVTVLQLISYFTVEGHRPKRGIVALLNNGEENGLYGAHNFLRHPLSQFTHTFLNLEGAGAGGRATLFRTTDTAVTNFYSRSPHPYGTVISSDGFKRGFIRSGTDYSVFTNDNNMRGLDVAFFDPRARYHTDQDDARNTSPKSVWHMLSSSLATMKAMTSYDGDEFEGSVKDNGKLDVSKGSDGVWFDVFGRAFAVMNLPTLFALSVTLLTAAPIILIALEITLRKMDRWYPLSRRQYVNSPDDDEAVHFSGLRGLLRFPIAFVVATAAVMALAYLLAKINPYIVYSSEYAVWIMMLSIWFSVAWFFLAGADRIRPTALQRLYCFVWLYALSWVALVASTVGENNLHIASGYFVVIYNASAFVALLFSYLELFALPQKTHYVYRVANAEEQHERRSVRPGSQSSRNALGPNESRRRSADNEEEATESTSLLGRAERQAGNTFPSFSRKRHPEDDGTLEDTDDPELVRAYGDEQAWSSSLPGWTWIIQFLVLAPINVVLIGQISLLLTTALHQTPADGNPVLPIYLFLAGLTVLLLLPLTPFLHRFTYQVPMILLLAFVVCLLYNLFAFPFTQDARLKVYFAQQIDLNNGTNVVNLAGLDGYIQDIIAELPSSTGQDVQCDQNGMRGLTNCKWHGLAPNVLANEPASESVDVDMKEKNPYKSWVEYDISHSGDIAYFSIQGRNTKQCRLDFDEPIDVVHIEDAASDPRYQAVNDDGSTQIRLFSRTWDKNFKVNVTWNGQSAKGQTGKVMCMWSEINQFDVVPAFDEILRFVPIWSTVTKSSDGLVEGYKEFEV